VVAADGTALLSFGRDDFELKVDGKPRRIKSVSLVRVRSSRDVPKGPDAPAAASTTATPATVGRTVILVFDHEHIRPANEHAAVQGALRMLDSLGPLDRVAVITLPNGRIEANLTSDFAAVRRALQHVVGRDTDLPGGIAKPEVGCTLMALLDFLRGLERTGGLKTMVLVSEGFSCNEAIRSRLDNTRDLEDLASLAASARTQFYIVQPNNAMLVDASRKLPGGLPDADVVRRDKATAVLEDIAGVTGGDLFRLSGSADNVFERLIRETSAYYEVAFEPLPSERDGKDHAISVTVNRPKVRVRARPSFAIMPPIVGLSPSPEARRPIEDGSRL